MKTVPAVGTVSFVTRANMGVASFRYRTVAPAQVLSEMGYKVIVDDKAEPEAGTVIFSKYWTANDVPYSQFCRLRGQDVIFDICDDHFETIHKQHYKEMIRCATKVTVNSEAMQERVQVKGNAPSCVIPDPVISAEAAFRGGDPVLCWYGNPQNVPGLLEAYPLSSGVPLEIAAAQGMKFPEEYHTDGISFTAWHPDIISEFAARCNIAFLPYRQGKTAKSANRILEALQTGMFVMADIIPASENIPGVWDLSQGVEAGIQRYWSHGEEDVLAGKEYVKGFSPEKIGEMWADVIGREE